MMNVVACYFVSYGHKVMTALNFCHIWFGSVGTETMRKTFEVFLWSFLGNIIDICLNSLSGWGWYGQKQDLTTSFHDQVRQTVCARWEHQLWEITTGQCCCCTKTYVMLMLWLMQGKGQDSMPCTSHNDANWDTKSTLPYSTGRRMAVGWYLECVGKEHFDFTIDIC